MKYLKEVCSTCGYVSETELTNNKNVGNTVMRKLSVYLMAEGGYQLVASMDGESCPRCIGLAQDELHKFMKASKYFENDLDIF